MKDGWAEKQVARDRGGREGGRGGKKKDTEGERSLQPTF